MLSGWAFCWWKLCMWGLPETTRWNLNTPPSQVSTKNCQSIHWVIWNYLWSRSLMNIFPPTIFYFHLPCLLILQDPQFVSAEPSNSVNVCRDHWSCFRIVRLTFQRFWTKDRIQFLASIIQSVQPCSKRAQCPNRKRPNFHSFLTSCLSTVVFRVQIEVSCEIASKICVVFPILSETNSLLTNIN